MLEVQVTAPVLCLTVGQSPGYPRISGPDNRKSPTTLADTAILPVGRLAITNVTAFFCSRADNTMAVEARIQSLGVDADKRYA